MKRRLYDTLLESRVRGGPAATGLSDSGARPRDTDDDSDSETGSGPSLLDGSVPLLEVDENKVLGPWGRPRNPCLPHRPVTGPRRLCFRPRTSPGALRVVVDGEARLLCLTSFVV